MHLCNICEKQVNGVGKRCSTCVSQIRRVAMKRRASEYKGGKCEYCHWTGCPAAFQFHHINRDNKEFNISRAHGLSWDKIVVELDKCIMLCSNCHATEHAIRYKDKKIIHASNDYLLAYKTVKGTGKKHTPIKDYIPWNKGVEMPKLQKVCRPSKSELKIMLWEMPTTKIAKQYGVSDTAVSKWAKFYNLQKPPRGYWTNKTIKS